MNQINQHSTCPLCSSKNIEVLNGYGDPELKKCADCSFVFASQIPSTDELIEYYGSDYDRTSYFSPITAVRYMQILEGFESLRKTNRILDVGCGYGFFLEIAKKKGWEVYGIEITKEATIQCREKGIEMFQGEIKDAPFEEASFDIIVSIEVIEHLVNPKVYVEQIHKLLRPGGKFYMSTPNFNALLRYRLKGDYDIIGYPNHLCYYTPKTLKKLFTEKGFKTESIKTTGVSLTRLRTSKGKSNQEYVSETSDDEMLRFKIEQNSFLRIGKNCTNSLLNLFKIGNSLKASFVKE